MIFRVEIGLRKGLRDTRGGSAAWHARHFLHIPVTACTARDLFVVAVECTPAEAEQICRALRDPVTSRAAVEGLPPPRFDWAVDVFLKPGVTDNLGRTAEVVVADVLGRSLRAGEGVHTGVRYFLRGRLERSQVARLAHEALANALIQQITVISRDEWHEYAGRPASFAAPVTGATQTETITLPDADEALLALSRKRMLALSLAEMRAIREYFGRGEVQAARKALGLPLDPTDVELECLAQTWSEHCKHKIFAARIRYADETGAASVFDSLFKSFIQRVTRELSTRLPWLVSVFKDNAGIIRFNDQLNLAYKVETHNTPSALDPYGGAITGIVGVNRDPMGTGMGCELLCNTWGYCFASPFYDGEVPQGLMHPRRIREGVHQGVMDGGNQSGIPWMRGWERFDERFLGKPLVFCGTLGKIPAQLQGRPSERKEIEPGDLIVMCGGRIGKDGIHGATFSSEALHEESPAQAVQIGDPITQRKLYEFLLEARDQGLYRAITDNGAGGLSSSIGELAQLSGGAELDLAKAPLKYPGLRPWEILLSEAQERMSLAVPAESVAALLALAARREVEASVIGRFTDSGALVLRHGDTLVARLEMAFLHEGCPQLELDARWQPPVIPAPRKPRVGARTSVLLELLRSLNVCSKEFKTRSYDAEVKGLSVIKPFVGVFSDIPSDATAMRVAHGSPEGVVLADAVNPFYSDLDTYHMAAGVVDEAVRRVLCLGGKLGTIAGLDNFCWPDPVQSESTPDGAYKLAQLVRANQALYDYCLAYQVPLISGKDSMKNDSMRGGRKISIPPTLLFSVLAPVRDVRRLVTLPFKKAGDLIYVAGLTRNELGASEYHRLLARKQNQPGAVGGQVPVVAATAALALYRALEAAHEKGLLRSCHTPTLGGLAVALAMQALGGNLGAEVNLEAVPCAAGCDADALLFSESHSRFVWTCAPADALELERLFAGVPLARIGVVTEKPELRVGARIQVALDKMRAAFKKPLWGI